MQTDPENDVIQIPTDGEMPQGENSENKYRRSNRNTNKPNRYGSIPFKEIFGYEKVVYFTGQNRSRTKGTPKPMPGTAHKPQDVLPENMTLPGTSSSPRRTPEREGGMLYGSPVNQKNLTFTEFRL